MWETPKLELSESGCQSWKVKLYQEIQWTLSIHAYQNPWLIQLAIILTLWTKTNVSFCRFGLLTHLSAVSSAHNGFRQRLFSSSDAARGPKNSPFCLPGKVLHHWWAALTPLHEPANLEPGNPCPVLLAKHSRLPGGEKSRWEKKAPLFFPMLRSLWKTLHALCLRQLKERGGGGPFSMLVGGWGTKNQGLGFVTDEDTLMAAVDLSVKWSSVA